VRVQLLVEMSGTRDGQAWPGRGNEIDLPDDEARQMISVQQAIPVVTRHVEIAVVSSLGAEDRTSGPFASERPLITKTGPVPGRKGTPR
jgi:hypothetical protein